MISVVTHRATRFLMQPDTMKPTPTRLPLAEVYNPTARKFHWWTVLLVLVMFPLGFGMVYRGTELKIWDATTNNLYSAHKLIGFIVLWLVVARLVYRVRNGAPADEPTLEWWQKLASHVTHWSLYGLLLVVPLLGWLGVSRYGALSIFGLFSLPPIATVNQDAAATIFWLHGAAAILMLLAIGAHFGAALFHYFIRKDGVLMRMLPGLRRR
jgi:cytochrome b561